jgi:nitroreductase
VILCADLKADARSPERYWRTAPPEVAQMVVQMMGMYEGREQLQRDEALRSGGMAAQTIMIAAKAMGYDSCPMAGFDFDAVGKLIRLPADHIVAMAIAVGKALEPARPRGGQLPARRGGVRRRISCLTRPGRDPLQIRGDPSRRPSVLEARWSPFL